MKIRRIVLLVLLAAGSVFLLSSCDAMLDAIFSNDTITVYVSAYIPGWGTPVVGHPGAYYLTSDTDTMSVSIVGPKNATATANYTGNDGYYMYWSVAVPQLSDGTYSVQVTYVHPLGQNFGSWPSVIQVVSLPAGSSHSVNLSFGF